MASPSTTPNKRCFNSRKRPNGTTWRRYEEKLSDGTKKRYTTIEIPIEEYDRLMASTSGEISLTFKLNDLLKIGLK